MTIRLPIHTLIPALALALALCGCSRVADVPPAHGPPAGYAYATATPDCAPWDGPAVTLNLMASPRDTMPPGFPRLRVSIWKRQDELAQSTFRWPADTKAGAAVRCFSEDSCEAATEGTIRFGTVRADSVIEGVLFFRWANGDSTRGSFRATWRPLRIACG